MTTEEDPYLSYRRKWGVQRKNTTIKMTAEATKTLPIYAERESKRVGRRISQGNLIESLLNRQPRYRALVRELRKDQKHGGADTGTN